MTIPRSPLLLAIALLALGAPARPLTAQLQTGQRVQVSLDTSEGTHSAWKTGAAVGAVVGAVGTFAALNRGGSTNPCDSDANQDAMGMRACLGIAALGGVAGALLGGLVGSLVHSEQSDGIRLDLLPPAGGRPLGLSFAFTPTRR